MTFWMGACYPASVASFFQAMRLASSPSPADSSAPKPVPRRATSEQRAVLEPQLLVVLDCDRPFEWPSRHLIGDVDRVEVTRAGARDAVRHLDGSASCLTLALADRRAAADHALFHRVGAGRWAVVDRSSRHGVRVNGVACERALLHDGDLVQIGLTLLMFRNTVPPVRRDVPDLAGDAAAGPLGLPTFVAALADAYATIERVAGTVVPVTLRGESGTGKDVVARALHTLSRREGGMVTIAGTAAAGKGGSRAERASQLLAADGGTLLLDDPGALPPAVQAYLSGALAHAAIVPAGATLPVDFDARLVTATRRPLEALVAKGGFRADLQRRLTGVQASLPRLADRREDLGLVVAALLRRRGAGPQLAPDAALALFRHDWPGNVRELERSLEAAALAAGGGPIEREHLHGWSLAATG